MSVEDKKRLGRRFFKGYTKLVESKYWYNHYVALIFGASPASNLGSLIAIDWKGNELISVTRFFGNNDNVKLYLGSNPETNMYELWLGLIGLDGDGSEFIIQSRESIDLDSKTVETLPSYLKVISISWQKNNDFSELGGLLPLASITSKGLISGLIVFNAYISSTTTCVLIEGSFNESGGMGVVNLDFRPYGMASYSISLFIDSVVRASVINGTNKNSFSIYYLTEGGLIRIKIIFIYDGPISMVARGNNTVIKSISKSENLDTNGFNKVTIS